jgi:hypothetical protein
MTHYCLPEPDLMRTRISHGYRKDTGGGLFVLDLSSGRIHSMGPDGFRRKVIAAECHLPDGIAVDVPGDRMFIIDLGGPVYCA